MYAAIIFIIAAVLFAAALFGSGSGAATDEEYRPASSHHSSPSETMSRTKYIDKHLHRDDEKHARHKQNQTPW